MQGGVVQGLDAVMVMDGHLFARHLGDFWGPLCLVLGRPLLFAEELKAKEYGSRREQRGLGVESLSGQSERDMPQQTPELTIGRRDSSLSCTYIRRRHGPGSPTLATPELSSRAWHSQDFLPRTECPAADQGS